MKTLAVTFVTIAVLALGVLLYTGFSMKPNSSAEATISNETGEAKPEYPGEAAAYMASLRQTPNGENPALLNLQAKQLLETRRSERGVTSLLNLKFEEWGPGNFAGRIRAIGVNTDDPDQLLIGGVDGGVWKTTDGGESWAAKGDFLPNLAVCSMVVDPDNPDNVFAGTGEGFFNVDAARGLGIFLSDDFGETWTHLASTQNSNFHYVNRLGMIPSTDVVLAATRAGLFRSADFGASWTEVSGISPSGRGFVDLRVDPSNTNRIYTYHYGGGALSFVMRSDDAGLSFTQLGAAQGLPTTNISRGEIGVGQDGTVYVAFSNASNATRGLWRAPAGGTNFAQTASGTPFIERQGWYDLICGVDPFDSDNVFVGAVDVYRTQNAGTNITRLTFWNPGAGQIPNYVHADIHNVTFHPTDAGTHWIGSDGGIFKTTDGGDTYISLNNDIRFTQYYGIAVHPTDNTKVIGGTQDNGSHLFFGDHEIWLRWFGGDGGYCAWDQQQPNIFYGSLPNASRLFGTSDGGFSTTDIFLPDNNGALFIEPFTLDPSDGNRMIVGTDNVFYSENIRSFAGAAWTDVSGSLGSSVSATTISPHDGQITFIGTASGSLFRAPDLGNGNTFTQINNGVPTGSAITWIEVDPHDPTSNTAYATLANYATDRVWKTTDGGQNWVSIHGDLPDIPMWSISVDPTDPDRLFLGSELGLFTTDGNTRGAVQWDHYDYGVAWSRVMQVRWTGDDTLWLGTHGRSIYRGSRNPVEIALGEIDDSSGDGDGILDLGETFQIPVSVTNAGGLDLQSVEVTVGTTYTGFDIAMPTQNLGTVAAGTTVVQNFEAELSEFGVCPDIADLTVEVTHTGGMDEGMFTLDVAADPMVQTGTFTEDAEGPTQFTHEAQMDVDDWAQVATQAHGGSQSWFAADVPNYADKSLVSPWLEVQGGSTLLSFWLFYDMEGDSSQHWDGAVLEMRTLDGEWEDIGLMSTLPYDGQLFDNSSLQYRFAWSGTQTTWRQGTVDLSATLNGETIQFRFRVACDTNTANVGFWVDDISITNVSWIEGLLCDPGCFADLNEAIDAVLASLGNGEWPDQKNVADYVDTLDMICPP